ncbi:hypothetical protein D3C75_642420 [compost metagenome]
MILYPFSSADLRSISERKKPPHISQKSEFINSGFLIRLLDFFINSPARLLRQVGMMRICFLLSSRFTRLS